MENNCGLCPQPSTPTDPILHYPDGLTIGALTYSDAHESCCKNERELIGETLSD